LARKYRLFAVACGRLIEHVIPREEGIAAINIAERFADGEASAADLKSARQAAWAAWEDFGGKPDNTALWTAAWWAEWKVGNAASQALNGVEDSQGYSDELLTHLCAIVRDIFGNPFRPPQIDSAWLAWNDGTLVRLAQGIYDARAFERLPILADALEEAGCDD